MLKRPLTHRLESIAVDLGQRVGKKRVQQCIESARKLAGMASCRLSGRALIRETTMRRLLLMRDSRLQNIAARVSEIRRRYGGCD